jgi:putative transposase
MAWCSRARPAPARSQGRCWWRWELADLHGKEEVIDFRLATAESAAQWAQFLGDLVRRGLSGEHPEILCVDGGCGLLAALPTAFPDIPVQRCWAHKIRNLLNKVRKPDQAAIKAGLHRIMNAATLPQATLRSPPLR